MNVCSNWTIFCQEMWCTYWSSNVQNKGIHVIEKQHTTQHVTI